MSIDTLYQMVLKMEIRIIGTKEELEQAAIQIAACYKIKYKSRIYLCRDKKAYRLYIKTEDNNIEEEKQLDGQMSFDEV
ncbi:hypothetical protein SAMN02910406_03110 [Ruminococcus albus]|uniref:Uncharacterized protein n=2 Tax=Ruminococcus albus TaxID=1264 RepID=A0A1I1PX43_RUMAL|nr:hypothetical protein SAMN02910406_03110 [Ruminococcus albus]